MERNEVKIHRLAKFKKYDPLLVDFAPTGKLRVRRWAQAAVQPPTGFAVTDLPAGCIAVVDMRGGLSEVRAK